jgi:hypothetical protein
MCNRRRIALIVVVTCAIASRLRAQTVSELLALKAKNDSALVAIESRRPAAVAGAVPPPEVLDTVRIGTVTLISGKEAAPVLRAGITGASERVRRAFGDAGTRALAQSVVTGHLRLAPPNAAGVSPGGVLNVHLDVGAVPGDLPREVWPSDSVDAAADIALWVSRAIRTSLDSTLRVWMPVLRPPGADSAEFGERAFRIAVASGSAAVRRCLAGDDTACKSALGLIPTDDPLHTWYDPVDYPDLLKSVSNLHAELETQMGVPVVTACLHDRDIASCTRVVPRIPHSALRPPMPDDVRSLLFLVAMQNGGDGAFDRLVADSASAPLARLAGAAKMPEHELLVAWRTRVTALRPARALPTAGIVLVSLLWIGCCFGAALKGTPWS